ncbi:serine/threonine protein phosphatase [Oligoflexia bacterium]|nr:serine/threonine protein phosphatase [Oligoflexia bacterium]
MEKYLELESDVDHVYAVGDIHGCINELSVLLNFLVEERGFSKNDIIIFIGDYIDRGPDSKGVLNLLTSFQSEYPQNSFFLRGNHEDMFLDFLGFDGTQGGSYLVNGGAQCVRSYEASPPYCGEEIQEDMPPEHIEFLTNLHRYIFLGDFVFTHAGVNPLRDLHFQLDEDIYWIRDEFLNNLHHFRKTVVFGHTPFEDVLFHLPYKIGIDTGLVYGSMLSCIEIAEEMVFQVYHGGRDVQVESYEKKGCKWPEIS